MCKERLGSTRGLGPEFRPFRKILQPNGLSPSFHWDRERERDPRMAKKKGGNKKRQPKFGGSTRTSGATRAEELAGGDDIPKEKMRIK
ncbi:hypothetical protein KIPB_016078, partial [Kipferlia bialata]|eukprot:g16078.t1